MKSLSLLNILTPVLLLMATICILFPAIYAFPAADDYCCAWLVKEHGFYLWTDFTQTNGRWIASLFQHASEFLVENIFFYRLVPIALFFSVFASVYYFFKTFKAGIPGIRNFYFTWFIVLLIFGNMPNLSEMLFWFSGSTTYLMAAIFSLLAWSTLFKAQNKHFYWFIGIPLLFFTTSFNEIAMFVAPAGAWLLNRSTNKKIAIVAISVFAITLTIALLSGGNHNRMAFFSDSFSMQNAVVGFFVQTTRFGFNFFFAVPIVWLLLAGALTLKNTTNRNIGRRFLLPAFPLLIAVGLPLAATGLVGQHRTINYAWFIFVVLLIIQNNEILKQPAVNFRKLFPILILALFISPNIASITEDMYRGKFSEFKQIMLQEQHYNSTGYNSTEFSKELIPESLMNIYPVNGWNSSANLCPDLYFGVIRKPENQ